MQAWPVIVVFAFTYVLIAARRLEVLPIGRPAGALAGACGMVVLSTIRHDWGLTPKEAFAAVELNTIGLLLGMMLLSAALWEAGFFEHAAAWVAARKLSPTKLLYAVALSSGLLSALLVNDSVCVMLTPLVDRTARRSGLNRTPYLLAVAMGANAGSALTLAGNPQNMLVATLSGVSYRDYLVHAGPAALVGLAVTAVTLHAVCRRRLAAGAPRAAVTEEAGPPPPARVDLWITFGCVVAVSIAFLGGANLAWTALAGATLAMLLRSRDPSPMFERVSWTILLFFAALFVVVAGLQRTGLPAQTIAWAAPHLPSDRWGSVAWLSGMFAVGCQIVSNVPFILLVEPFLRVQPDPRLAWTVTALVTTLVGNLTLLGSVANIIVVEQANAHDEIGFLSYLKIGLPVTIASTAAAIVCLLSTW